MKNKRMKQKFEANIMTGYDEEGNLIMFCWQKEPIKTQWGFNFKVPWHIRYNPIWRIKQWLLVRRHYIYEFDSFKMEELFKKSGINKP